MLRKMVLDAAAKTGDKVGVNSKRSIQNQAMF